MRSRLQRPFAYESRRGEGGKGGREGVETLGGGEGKEGVGGEEMDV